MPVFPYASRANLALAPDVELDVEAAGEPAPRDTEVAQARDFSERLLRSFLGMCESPRTRKRMLRLVQASVGNGPAGRRFYALLNRAVVHPVARLTGVHASALRIELVCGQLAGLAMMRYVLEVEPIASAPMDDVVRQFAPAIRATVAGG